MTSLDLENKYEYWDISSSGMTHRSPGKYNMEVTLDIDAKWGCVPEKVIYNGTTTICVFPNGVKITARPTEDDDFDKEVGVAMCVMKRIFGSRSEFQRVVERGYEQEKKKLSGKE